MEALMDENSSSASGWRPSIGERARIGLAALFGLVCGISCLSIDLGSHSVESPASHTLKQEGTLNNVSYAPGPIAVYYPRPYISPPNLEVISSESSWSALNCIEVLEQKADYFSFRWKSTFPNRVIFEWKAVGVPVGLPLGDMTKAPPPSIVEEHTKAARPPAPLTPADAVTVESGGK
jgi:hypothetical protein